MPSSTVPEGRSENRIKEHQLDLFSDRTSTHEFESNQLRLWFSSFAYVLLQSLRQHCLAQTELATALRWHHPTQAPEGGSPNPHQR